MSTPTLASRNVKTRPPSASLSKRQMPSQNSSTPSLIRGTPNLPPRNQRLNSAKSEKSVTSGSNYTIDTLVDEILKKKIVNIVVMTGAGISTPSGIPDFRTPGTGLYDNLKKFNIPYPEAIFEIEYLSRNPKPFFTLAKEIMPNVRKYKPNKIHYFLRLLQDKQLLHRLYTQNIDGLERLSGILPDKLVEAHGTFSNAKCTGCSAVYSDIFVNDAINNNKIPRCQRSNCRDIVKPNIVFFGESLPKRFDMHSRDFSQAQLIIVMGTSLKVEPFASIIKGSHVNTPRLLLNREAVGPFKNIKRRKDVVTLGNLIESLDELVDKLGWKNELEELMETEIQKLNEPVLTEITNTVNDAEKSDSDKEEQNCAMQSKSAISNQQETIVLKALKTRENFNGKSLAELLYLPNGAMQSTIVQTPTRENFNEKSLAELLYLPKEIVSSDNASKENSNCESQLKISPKTKQKIVEQNDRVLGINSTNKVALKNNSLLNKRQHLDSTRIKSAKLSPIGKPPPVSDKAFSLLPPHYNRVTVNRGINMMSPFNKDTFTTYNNKYSLLSAKSNSSSRTTSNSRLKLNSNLNTGSQLKKKHDKSDSSDSESNDSTSSSSL